MSSYDEMLREFNSELKSMIKSQNLEPSPVYEENCDTCGNSIKQYYIDKDGSVVAYSCFGCNDVGTL